MREYLKFLKLKNRYNLMSVLSLMVIGLSLYLGTTLSQNNLNFSKKANSTLCANNGITEKCIKSSDNCPIGFIPASSKICNTIGPISAKCCISIAKPPSPSSCIPEKGRCKYNSANKQSNCCVGLECPSLSETCTKPSSAGTGGGTPPKAPKAPKKPPKQPRGGSGETGGSCPTYKPNPSIMNVTMEGNVIVYTKAIIPNPIQMALKKNADTCGLQDADQVLNIPSAELTEIKTEISVVGGDKLCVYLDDGGTPSGGWVEPSGNSCGVTGEPMDISNLLTEAPQAFAVQCWSDPIDPSKKATDCDFNDYALVFTTDGELGGGGEIPIGDGDINFALRFQGITSKANDQLIKFDLLKSGSSVMNETEYKISNDQTGVYLLSLTDDPQFELGSYELVVKGPSHLQKRFKNIDFAEIGETVDLSTTEENQLRAGDVNNDNKITIEDISQVLSYYKSLSVDVNENDSKMVSSDVNKDGKITIQDVALISINWSDFEVVGEE